MVNSSTEWYDVSKFQCQQNTFWAREWNQRNIFQAIIYCSSYYVFTTLITSIHFITAPPFIHALTRTSLINPVSKLRKMIHLIQNHPFTHPTNDVYNSLKCNYYMLSPSSTLKLSILTTGYSSVFCKIRRIQNNYFSKQHKLGFLQLRQEIRNMDCILTLWRRNYFFLISAHPVYKM